MKAILLIGNAGSGKTWVMKQLIQKFQLNKLGKTGMLLYHRNDKLLVLGKYDDTTFEGSDKLSMAVMRDLPKFLELHGKKKITVVCEGDRFTNSTFISSCNPTIIRIEDDGVKGRQKRKSNQTERQIKSIATRVSNITPDIEVLNSEGALETILQML